MIHCVWTATKGYRSEVKFRPVDEKSKQPMGADNYHCIVPDNYNITGADCIYAARWSGREGDPLEMLKYPADKTWLQHAFLGWPLPPQPTGPVPRIDVVYPPNIRGPGTYLLTIDGANFDVHSVVMLNGSDLDVDGYDYVPMTIEAWVTFTGMNPPGPYDLWVENGPAEKSNVYTLNYSKA